METTPQAEVSLSTSKLEIPRRFLSTVGNALHDALFRHMTRSGLVLCVGETVEAQVSVEDKLTAAFEKAGMRDDPAPPGTEPDEPDESGPEETAEAETSEGDEPQTDGTPDAEEVEFDGETYQLPKKLKDAVLRQKDYTQKTQQVAELRKSVEERQEALKAEGEFQQKHFDKVVQAHALAGQLQQFAQVNWSELANADPAAYLKLDRQQRELQEALNRVNGDIQQAGTQFQAERVQQKQKAQARCIEELKKDFKDFGPEFLKGLDDTGKSFGFSGEELASIADPRMVRVLHAAMQYKKLQGSRSLVQKKVQDAKPVQVKAARSAPNSHAVAQMNQLRDQARKTGNPKDAEAHLASLFAKRVK